MRRRRSGGGGRAVARRALRRAARRLHQVVARRARAGRDRSRPRRRSARSAWQRQPPKSIVRSSQVRHGSGIQASPRKARKAGESFQIVASERSRTLSKLQRRDAAGLVAGQRGAVGRDDEVAARPAVHAGARAIGVVVGAHEQHLDAAAQPLRARRRRSRARRRPAARDGSSASRLTSAQPRYCVLASSSRSAPRRSASATNSAVRAMLPRWSTTLSVSGRPSARAAAAISSLPSSASRPAIRAAPAGSTS